MINRLLRIGYKRDEVYNLNWYQINDIILADVQNENEILVMQMNCTAVAFGGTAKQRRQMANTLLGVGKEKLDLDKFEQFGFLATPADANSTHQVQAKAWAEAVFDPKDEAFKINNG